MDLVDNLTNNTNPEAIRAFPQNLALKYKMCPLRVSEGTLTLATSNPFNISAIEDLSMIIGLSIKTVLSTRMEIDSAIDRLYSKRTEKNEFGEDLINESDFFKKRREIKQQRHRSTLTWN
jgi:type II secretory ATPase GspE/PulE/Tfp pilus assembly ATPase PilB-like protein